MENSKELNEYQEISKIQSEEENEILFKNNVRGVAIGNKFSDDKDTGDASLIVFVSHKLDAKLLSKDDLVPKTCGKFKTDVVETGDFFAGTALEVMENTVENAGIQLLHERVRPVKGGYSIGHPLVTAGTMATAVYDNFPFPCIPQKYYILSNNHVIANSNNARVGDPILQPGRVDGGTDPSDRIGRLSRWVPIRFDGSNNLVDAAIAEADFHLINREIYWNGYVEGYSENPKQPWFPNLPIDGLVRKTGRTTHYTTGRLTAFNATITVNFAGGRQARFIRQIVAGNMSAGGDSGSLVTDFNGNAVGLLFAGSATSTIINPIFYVRNLLKIRLF